MAYNRDLQEDKRAVFHADDTLASALPAIGGLLATADFHPPEPDNRTVALDVAEALVKKGVPFREAHEAVGRLVADEGLSSLQGASLEQLRAAHAQLEVGDVPGVADAVAGRAGLLRDQTERLRGAIKS
jgi:argininosuccinate lyase